MIAIYTEKAYGKSQYPFMINHSRKSKGELLQSDKKKGFCEKPTAVIT